MSTPQSGPQRPPSQRDRQRPPPDKSISQIEKSVTHLLVATKQLLETLTQWSRKQAQEEEVSDVYVRLGYEFNLACRAFNSIGVETSDLGPVPDLLRSILEDTLSQPASPQALDNYLPRIRDIIINLLHGLKRKQSRLRSRPSKDGSSSRLAAPARQGSSTSLDSTTTGLTNMLENVPTTAASTRTDSRQDSVTSVDDQPFPSDEGPSIPKERLSTINRHSLRRERPVTHSDSSSSISSTTAQDMPVLPPYADPDQTQVTPTPQDSGFLHAPPPPPKQQDALTALQRGGDLERRASRRFSQYQITKHLGASPNGVATIPPAQNSPIPNRGREIRESMAAVRARASYQHGRTKSGNSRFHQVSPSREASELSPQRISEEREEPVESQKLPPLQEVPTVIPPDESALLDSPTAKTPEEYHQRPAVSQVLDQITPDLGATVNGPLSPQPAESYFPNPTPPEAKPIPPQHQSTSTSSTDEIPAGTAERKPRFNATQAQSQMLELESSPPQGKELTLFLQYKSKIKKFVLSEGYDELTTARLQLAFIEKFAWNTHSNPDLPEIYIQDPVSGVRHELEDLSDVKDRSVLVLNVEVLDEVKRHFDDGIGGLRKTLESVRSLLDGQGSMMQRVSDRQLETSKEVARMSAVPSRPTTRAVTSHAVAPLESSSTASATEVQSLRRDIAVLRQTYSNMTSHFTSAMTDIRAKATTVKAFATEAAMPSYEGNAGRAHVNSGKKALSQDSEKLVNRVDDLSDLVEELRKDVVMRGVRPLPRQLEGTSRDITDTIKDLAKMKEFMKREKPIWTKIWEQELALVCTERDDLTQQEELMADLQGDLDDLTGVFKLVEEATKQQNLQNGAAPAGVRSTSRGLPFDTDVDPLKAKDGVLGEVRALQPNHETRLEAIERAEKLRQKELESRKGGEFQREVEEFVEGGKLKKTGGADEVERLRKLKDERARKENWALIQQRQLEMEKRRAEEAAAATDAHAEAVSGGERPSSYDTSQEGEAEFEDASEQNHASPPSANGDTAPQHPQWEASTKSDRGSASSSWLPAIFSSTH